MDVNLDSQLFLDWLKQSGLRILLIVVLAIIAQRLLNLLSRYLTRQIKELDDVEGSELDKRTDTIFRVINSTGLVLIIGTAVLMILTELGVPVAPVFASVGVVGLALGLGAQTIVKDMISGLFILAENQFTVGDTVEITGITGTVERMTLRATIIRDIYGTVHTVPNGDIRVVSNKSRDWSRAILDVGITYDDDIDHATQTLKEISDAMNQDEVIGPLLLEEMVITGVEGLDDWAVRLRMMVKTLPGQHFTVQRYLRQQIRLVFEQKGINLAFPRQDILVLQSNKEK